MGHTYLDKKCPTPLTKCSAEGARSIFGRHPTNSSLTTTTNHNILISTFDSSTSDISSITTSITSIMKLASASVGLLLASLSDATNDHQPAHMRWQLKSDSAKSKRVRRNQKQKRRLSTKNSKDFSWVEGSWQECINGPIIMNGGFVVPDVDAVICGTTNTWSISPLGESARKYKLTLDNPLLCSLIGVAATDCSNVTMVEGRGGTVLSRKKFYGHGSYAASQQNQITFYNDNFAILDASGNWIDFTKESDPNGQMTCYKEGEGSIACDLYSNQRLSATPVFPSDVYSNAIAYTLVKDISDCDFCTETDSSSKDEV